jgi:hypothetical protein
MNTKITPNGVLSPNRAEELGDDVWDHFVVPFFYPDLDLVSARKARIIMGGRGCGKTMLLRYLSHASQFSPRRIFKDPNLPDTIGIYWRIDTQFANTMRERAVPEDIWISAFQHAAALYVGRSILQSLMSISSSKCELINYRDIDLLDFSGLQAFDGTLPGSITELMETLRKCAWAFETWINNPRQCPPPIFLPGAAFIRGIIAIIHDQLSQLRSVFFSVYIDEYENLLEYQQRIINTLLKHGEPPLVFHVATKRNGIRTRRTLGEEEITDIADYRTIDLDTYLHENSFNVLAAEILFLRLSHAGYTFSFLDILRLRDVGRVSERKKKNYQEALLAAAQQMLPSLTEEHLADRVFSDRLMFDRLLDTLRQSLKAAHSSRSPEDFVSEAHKRASVVCPCIIARQKVGAEVVLNELRKLEAGEPNKFSGNTDWVHNNFIGQVLLLYTTKHRACPFYAGFQSFILLSRGNLRHFLELCYASVKHAEPCVGTVPLMVSIDDQASAAKEASGALLKEIRGFGRQGNRLHSFTLALGSLFALAHSRLTQSEPEISHFSVGGSSTISAEDQDLLNEAVKWSVLFEEEETKNKEAFRVERTQWVLNPIYAPYFGITYRKRRKLEISASDLHVLMVGTYDEKRKLLNIFMERWSVTTKSLNLSLFSHLD